MKIALKISTVLFASAFSLSCLANASDSSVKVEADKTVKVKCYVQLVGGGETISLWIVQPSLLKDLSNSIVGQEVMLIGSKEKAKIYSTKECVLEESEFNNTRARSIDKKLPR